MFDIHLFREDPSVFYSLANKILPATKDFSPTHAFIRLVQDKDKLLTNYSQNIDNLEGFAGIRPDKLIQCHGSFKSATCQECRYQVPGEEIFKDLQAGRIARCERCIQNLRQSKSSGMKRVRSSNGGSHSRSRKRDTYADSSDDERYEVKEAGIMKVF